MTPGYAVRPARYSKGNHIISVLDSVGGFKGRASYLCSALNMRWVNREKGYVTSPSKLRKFQKLYADGWRATCMGELVAPDSDNLEALS